MYHFEAPETDKTFVLNRLLSASKNCQKPFAASALRAWWYARTPQSLIENGLCTTHHSLIHNNNAPEGNMLTHIVRGRDGENRLVLLSVFNDGSAVVMRCIHEFGEDDSDNEYQVLPVVLRLASNIRFADGAPDLGMKVGKVSKEQLGVKLTRTVADDMNMVTLDAPWTSLFDEVDFEYRGRIRDQLILQATQWLTLMDDLPALFLPKDGQDPVGKLNAQQLEDLNMDPRLDLDYMLPAFLPWCSITKESQKDLTSFCISIARWMRQHLIGKASTVSIEIDSTPLTQKRSNAVPNMRVIVEDHPGSQTVEHKDIQSHLKSVLHEILSSDLSPATPATLIGQEEFLSGRSQAWMDTIQFVRCFATERNSQNLSSHDVMDLRLQFDKFWPAEL